MVRIRSKLVFEGLILVCLAVFWIANVVPASAACPRGTDNVYKWTGGAQYVPSVQGISAILTAYNPSPIYQYCSFWVMLDRSNRYAQVGWVKWTGMQNEYVWAEFTDDNGSYYQFFYNKQLNTWVLNQPSTIPESAGGYFVTYTAGTPGTISMQYDNSPLLTYHGNWVPNDLQVYGETHNYGAANAGDRMPGVTGNKALANTILKKVNGSWSWASLTMVKQGWGNYDTSGATHGFYIWDTRNCN